MTYRPTSRQTPPSIPPKIPLGDGRTGSTYTNSSTQEYTRVDYGRQNMEQPSAPYQNYQKTLPAIDVNEEAKQTRYRVPSLNNTVVNGHKEHTRVLPSVQKLDIAKHYTYVDHTKRSDKEYVHEVRPESAQTRNRIKRKSVSPQVEQHNFPTLAWSPVSHGNEASFQDYTQRNNKTPALESRHEHAPSDSFPRRYSLPYPDEDKHVSELIANSKHQSWDNDPTHKIEKHDKTSIVQSHQVPAASPTHPLPPPPSPSKIHRHPLPPRPPIKTEFTDESRLSAHSAVSDDMSVDYPLEQYGFSMPYGYDAIHPLPQLPSPTSSIHSRSSSLVAHYDTQSIYPSQPSTFAPSQSLLQSPKNEPTATPERLITAQDNRHILPKVPLHTSTIKYPIRVFDASELTFDSFSRCNRVWSLSCIADWLADVTSDANMFTSWTASDALVRLFTFSIQTLSSREAQKIAQTVLSTFVDGGVLEEMELEDSLCFTDAEIQGVFPQLTNGGCYAPRCTANDELLPIWNCYSRHCSNSRRRIVTHTDGGVEEDWATFWHFDQGAVIDMDKQQVMRQNIIHEIIVKEAEYVRDLGVINGVMQASLDLEAEKVFAPQRKSKFMQWVFGRADAVYQVNMQHLLPQLQTRQADQGPIIREIGDVFAAWLNNARTAYLAYAAGFPLANKLMTDARRNTAFAAWEARFESDPRSQRLGVLHFLNRPNQRIGRYILLLKTVADKTRETNSDSQMLGRVIQDMEELALECNTRVGEAEKNVALIELGERLSWRPGSTVVDLDLDKPQRKILRQGLLLRQSDSRLEWVESLVVLLDHFLLITKEKKDTRAPNGAWYFVSKKPIKLDHLVITSIADDAERKSRKALGMGALTTTVDLSTPTSVTSKSLSKVSSNSSLPTPIVSNLEENMEGIMFPLRIRHVSKETTSYTLYASTAQTRTRWGEELTRAMESYNKVLSSGEIPFSVHILADQTFGYFPSDRPRLNVFMRGGVVEKALDEFQYSASDKTSLPVNRRISCATRFDGADGRSRICVGTEQGVWCLDTGGVRKWYKSGISLSKVTQMQVITEMSIIVVLADKQLFSYDIEALWQTSESEKSDVSWTGSRVSPAGGVGYFAVTTSMEGRTLILVKTKRREGTGSQIDVVEPVMGKACRRGFCRVIGVDGICFRDFDSYTVLADSFGLDIFESTAAVLTSKGFEILEFASKRSMVVPTKSSSHLLLSRVRGKQAVRMFKIHGGEFLLCYEEFAIYVDGHGDISRPWAMEFSIRAKVLALHYPYVVAFEQESMEVLEVETGVSRQFITGVDVHCLDCHEVPIKFTMAHPTLEGRQLVCELLQNPS